jgi:hypothetical protein
MIKKTIVTRFDETTGVVYSEKIQNIKSVLWKDDKGAILKPRNYHNKFYQDTKLSEIIENKSDLLKIYILTEHIYKNTNMIYVKTKNNSFRPADINDLSGILELCDERVKKFIRKMKNIGIIAELTVEIKKFKYSVFVFNPIYINSCKYISNELYLLFKPYLDEYFPEWIKDKYDELNQNNDGQIRH